MADSPVQQDGFAEIQGSDRVRNLLEDAFSIYGGRADGNTLSKLVHADAAGTQYFVNDNVWWKYSDFQCNYHATYGWRPFFNSVYRKIDRNTWQSCFRFQVTKTLQEYFKNVEGAATIPPLNWLPYAFDPNGKIPYPFDALAENPSVYSVERYYSNISVDPQTKKANTFEHAENTDYPLMNCITATDHILWERDVAQAVHYLPKMDAFLEALREHCRDSSGLLRVGTQGSQIEFGHYGFRYPAHTHVYLMKAYRNVQETARMAGDHVLEEKYEQRAKELARQMPLFLEEGKWFVGGLKDAEGRVRLGTGRVDETPSSYFDTWHNVNAVVLHVADDDLSRSIVERIASVPALTANHLTLVNYPARPKEEIDPNYDGFPPPGFHVNGGWMWMCAASTLYAYVRTQREDALDRLAELLSDHHKHYSIDYYNNYGADKGSQWPEHGRDSYSVTCAGAFGMLFRALLDLQVTADSLQVSPRLPAECERLKTKAPVYYAGKEIYFDVRNAGRLIRHVKLNGKSYDQHDTRIITLPHGILEGRNVVEIEMQE